MIGAAGIPHYASPLSPGRRLEGPGERFGVRGVWTANLGTMYVIVDRATGEQVPTVPARFYSRENAATHASARSRDPERFIPICAIA